MFCLRTAVGYLNLSTATPTYARDDMFTNSSIPSPPHDACVLLCKLCMFHVYLRYSREPLSTGMHHAAPALQLSAVGPA